MRLIDADALPKYTGYALSADEVATAVENAPTVDAVSVVRCKDCKWWNSNKETCIEIGGLWRSSDFCSWGERREDADT